MRDVPFLEKIGLINYVELVEDGEDNTPQAIHIQDSQVDSQSVYVTKNSDFNKKTSHGFNQIIVKEKSPKFHFLSRDLDGNTSNIVKNHMRTEKNRNHKKIREKVAGFMSNTKIVMDTPSVHYIEN